SSEAGPAGVHPEGRRGGAAARRGPAGRQDRPAGHGLRVERHLRDGVPRVLPYGFRPGRSQHRALDALYVGLLTKKVSWVLDVDIRAFFDTIDHGWLRKFLGNRIADRRIVRLIQKWLNAGVLEEGTRTRVEEGTPQGGSVSPLLANTYLHYGFELWVQVGGR